MKHGFWNDAHKNYSYRIQIVYQGEYSHGWKKGRWNILLKDQIIGGGVYDKGVRQGKWVDIDEYYTDYRQVQCEGDYLNGKKNGQWDLIFQGLVIGGGEYKDGIKNGKWIILDSKWKPFEQQFKQVIYQNGMQQSSK